ncbi:hypothetical protein NL676_025583 [Syzygium grande]|nr:hypothetical protein NL676_025583 [Syzygium grande]
MDMSEALGVTQRRKRDLYRFPSPISLPSPVETSSSSYKGCRGNRKQKASLMIDAEAKGARDPAAAIGGTFGGGGVPEANMSLEQRVGLLGEVKAVGEC